MNYTNVTDLGLELIVKLPALKVLDLCTTRISDKAKHYLASKAGLEEIDLDDTRVNPQRSRPLKPRCLTPRSWPHQVSSPRSDCQAWRHGPTSPLRRPRSAVDWHATPPTSRDSLGYPRPHSQPFRDDDWRRRWRFSFCRAAFRRDSSRRCFSTCSGWLAAQRSGSNASRSVSPTLNRSNTSRT